MVSFIFWLKNKFFSPIFIKIWSFINCVLFPNVCINCYSLNVSTENESITNCKKTNELSNYNINNYFCEKCIKKIIPINQNECCERCGYPMPKENFLDTHKKCHCCELLHPQFNIARSCFEYRGIIRHLLLMLKYHFSTDCLDFIGKTMYKIYLENMAIKHFQQPDIVCFVPITQTKLITKTFNHSAIIANAFFKEFQKHNATAKQTEILYDFFVKTQKTKQAKLLNQQERITKKHFFSINQKYLTTEYKNFFSNKTILIIDDIMTTGGTLNELSIILKKAFNHCQIECLTFARTILY